MRDQQVTPPTPAISAEMSAPVAARQFRRSPNPLQPVAHEDDMDDANPIDPAAGLVNGLIYSFALWGAILLIIHFVA